MDEDLVDVYFGGFRLMLLGLVAGDSLRDSFLQWFDSMGDRSLLAPDDSQRDRI